MFLDDHLKPGLLTESAILVVVSVISGAVSIVSGFAGLPEETQRDEFLWSDDDTGDWPI